MLMANSRADSKPLNRKRKVYDELPTELLESRIHVAAQVAAR